MHGGEHTATHADDDTCKLEPGTHALPVPNDRDKFSVHVTNTLTGAWLNRSHNRATLGLISEKFGAYATVSKDGNSPPTLAFVLDDLFVEPTVQVLPPGNEWPNVVFCPLSEFLAAVDWTKLAPKPE